MNLKKASLFFELVVVVVVLPVILFNLVEPN